MVKQAVAGVVDVALSPLVVGELPSLCPPRCLPSNPPGTIQSSTSNFPRVSCVGVNIAGSTDETTHGTLFLAAAVGPCANDLAPTGSGVGVPADIGASNHDGTPTPLPQLQAGRRSSSVNVCAKPGATTRSETLTLPVLLMTIARAAMGSSRLLVLCVLCRSSCTFLVVLLLSPPPYPPWDEALAGVQGKQAPLLSKQAASLPYPAQRTIDGVGVLVPAAPVRRGGGTVCGRTLEPRWAPLRRLEKAAELHGPVTDTLLVQRALGRDAGRGPSVVTCNWSMGR